MKIHRTMGASRRFDAETQGASAAAPVSFAAPESFAVPGEFRHTQRTSLTASRTECRYGEYGARDARSLSSLSLNTPVALFIAQAWRWSQTEEKHDTLGLAGEVTGFPQSAYI